MAFIGFQFHDSYWPGRRSWPERRSRRVTRHDQRIISLKLLRHISSHDQHLRPTIPLESRQRQGKLHRSMPWAGISGTSTNAANLRARSIRCANHKNRLLPVETIATGIGKCLIAQVQLPSAWKTAMPMGGMLNDSVAEAKDSSSTRSCI